jgi:hypothetical protein
MGFILLAAIFLTSTGFLVNAAITPSPPATTVLSPASGSRGEEITVPQSHSDFPEMNVPRVSQMFGQIEP